MTKQDAWDRYAAAMKVEYFDEADYWWDIFEHWDDRMDW